MNVRKLLLGCLVGLPASVAVLASVVAVILYWPVIFHPKYTLPIEGRVVDKTTGEPVEKVLVTSEWSFRRPVLLDTTTWVEREVAVSKPDGRFRIPMKKITLPWSKFAYESLHFRHPLHEFARFQVVVEGEATPRIGTVRNGSLVLDVPLSKVEEIYSRPDQNADLSVHLSGIHPEFFSFMKQRFGITYDVDAILSRLEILAHRFPQGMDRDGYSRLMREYNLMCFRFGRKPGG